MILPPVETNNGIAVDDPWQPVSDQLSAADIGFLVDNGYAVGAASLSEGGETTAPCPDDFDANSMALSELAVKVETDLSVQLQHHRPSRRERRDAARCPRHRQPRCGA